MSAFQAKNGLTERRWCQWRGRCPVASLEGKLPFLNSAEPVPQMVALYEASRDLLTRDGTEILLTARRSSLKLQSHRTFSRSSSAHPISIGTGTLFCTGHPIAESCPIFWTLDETAIAGKSPPRCLHRVLFILSIAIIGYFGQ